MKFNPPVNGPGQEDHGDEDPSEKGERHSPMVKSPAFTGQFHLGPLHHMTVFLLALSHG